MKIFLMVLLVFSALNVAAKIIVLAYCAEMPQRTSGNVAWGAIEDLAWAGFALYFVLTMP